MYLKRYPLICHYVIYGLDDRLERNLRLKTTFFAFRFDVEASYAQRAWLGCHRPATALLLRLHQVRGWQPVGRGLQHGSSAGVNQGRQDVLRRLGFKGVVRQEVSRLVLGDPSAGSQRGDFLMKRTFF